LREAQPTHYDDVVGHVHVEVTLKAKRSARVRFLVDTGATYALVPPALARRVGMAPSPVRDRVRLANGRQARLPTAVALVRIDGRETAALFWIGACDEPLLGVETLEALGLAVEPARGRLRPTRSYATRLGGFGPR
jgi:clan AA aspartic protease